MRILACHPGASYSVADVYDGLTRALVRAGHEVIPYALDGRLEFATEYLEALWKRRLEKDPQAPKPTPEETVYLAASGALERASWYQPDVVLIVSALWFPPPALIDLRRCGYFVATLLTESPYSDEPQGKIAALSNVSWTNERSSVPKLRQANPNVFYLAASFDPERHRVDWSKYHPIESDVLAHDVVLVGTGFPERIALLESIDWTGMDLGLYGTWIWEQEDSDGEKLPGGIGPESPLVPFVKAGPIPNSQTVELYRRAKIGLNLHRTSRDFLGEMGNIDHAESLNPRAYELAACGVFTISDDRAEVGEVFGDLMPTFRTPAELERLIRYYLAHDQERSSIAARLPVTVAGQSFDQRAAQLVADIERVKKGEGGTKWRRDITADFRGSTSHRELEPLSR